MISRTLRSPVRISPKVNKAQPFWTLGLALFRLFLILASARAATLRAFVARRPSCHPS